MRIRPFELHTPASLEEALEQLREWGPEAKVLAGGTDLVLAMKHKMLMPANVISLHRLTTINYIRKEDNLLRLGAMVTHADLATSLLVQETVPIISAASRLIGSRQIRNVATLGGNIANASPSADAIGPLLALDARVILADTDGEQDVMLRDFFTGPGKTLLKPYQLIKEFVLDLPGKNSAGRYLKLMRKGIDLALVGVTIQAETDSDGQKLTRMAIALGAVAPTPIRASEAESILSGLACDEALNRIPEAARAAVAASSPISDVRASAAYRRTIIEAYVRQGTTEVIQALMAKVKMNGGQRP